MFFFGYVFSWGIVSWQLHVIDGEFSMHCIILLLYC